MVSENRGFPAVGGAERRPGLPRSLPATGTRAPAQRGEPLCTSDPTLHPLPLQRALPPRKRIPYGGECHNDCRLSFRGEKLLDLQRRYFAGEGAVPIYAFRRTFGRVNALVRTAKKKAKSRLERERSEGVGL